jgi:hypothetical protein
MFRYNFALVACEKSASRFACARVFLFPPAVTLPQTGMAFIDLTRTLNSLDLEDQQRVTLTGPLGRTI